MVDVGRESKPSSARTWTGTLIVQTMLTALTISDLEIHQRGDASQSDHAPDARCQVMALWSMYNIVRVNSENSGLARCSPWVDLENDDYNAAVDHWVVPRNAASNPAQSPPNSSRGGTLPALPLALSQC